MSEEKGIPEAIWELTLKVSCPHCDEYIDLMDTPDFYDGQPLYVLLEPAESVDAWCSECEKDFKCDLAW